MYSTLLQYINNYSISSPDCLAHFSFYGLVSPLRTVSHEELLVKGGRQYLARGLTEYNTHDKLDHVLAGLTTTRYNIVPCLGHQLSEK